MNVEKIFSDPEVVKVENEIVDLWENGRHWTPEGTKQMKELIRKRWLVLRDFNEYDYETAQLLTTFNERLKSALTTLYGRTQKVYEEYMARDDYWGEFEVTGKCFLGYEYPVAHPVQSERAHGVREVLSDGGFEGLYDSGVTNELIWRKDLRERSLNQVLYLSDESDNWNECLNREWSSHMNLIFPFHYLYTDLHFGLYDLLWVQEFSLEINVQFYGDLKL